MKVNDSVQPFRRLLRDKKTSQWLDGNGQPVGDLTEAKEFESIGEIMQFCRKLDLHNQEIVLKHPQDQYDIVLDYREK
ncbi:MAG: hypothetical protein JWQ71_1752 [Pedosphaera sp.]|nr:hypothetical protein [Pedosphaera sp.]